MNKLLIGPIVGKTMKSDRISTYRDHEQTRLHFHMMKKWVSIIHIRSTVSWKWFENIGVWNRRYLCTVVPVKF